MHRIVFFSALILAGIGMTGMAAGEDDPLKDAYIIRSGEGHELVVGSADWNKIVVEMYHYYSRTDPGLSDTLKPLANTWTLSAPGIQGLLDFWIVSANMDGQELDEVAVAWDSCRSAVLSIARFSTFDMNTEKQMRWSSADSVVFFSGSWVFPVQIRVTEGEFDGDIGREPVMAYWATDTTVRVLLFDVDTSLAISLIDSIGSERIVTKGYPSTDYRARTMAITAGDMDGDSLDEIIFTGAEPARDSGWNVFVRCYDYDTASKSLVEKVKTIVLSDTQMTQGFKVYSINACAAQFRATGRDDAVISIKTISFGDSLTTRPDSSYMHVIPVMFSSDLDTARAGPGSPVLQSASETWEIDMSSGSALMVTAVDRDHDGIKELVSIGPGTGRIYTMNEDGSLLQADDFSASVPAGIWYPVAADFDYQSDSAGMRIEVGGVSALGSANSVRVYSLPSPADSGSFIQQAQTPLANGGQFMQVASGDFDGNIQLGAPKKFRYTGIVEPMVILNAPPIHFDIFNDTAFDVSLSYNSNSSQFVSSYTKETVSSVEVEREYNRDWGMSKTMSFGASGSMDWVGVEAKASLTERYGEKFSKTSSNSHTVTVAVSVGAKEDDRIYATVVDYDMWEYPVYYNDGCACYVMVVEPAVVENRWFPSKSWSAYTYVPDHEVGNILSYRAPADLSSIALMDERIKGSYSNSFVLDANSSYDWKLSFDDFSANSSSTTKEYSREWEKSAGVSSFFGGFSCSMSGHYSTEEINTQRTSVASGLDIEAHLDGIDMGVGEVGYTVTPYAYWATNGALTLDFAVQPEISASGGTPTWWQDRYGERCDPTFILPWRYDPEKGFTLQDEAKRRQTKDIMLFPANPEAGDTITILARIHNFALKQTPRPVGVRFYVGDPDSGGTLISAVDGSTIGYTLGEILDREVKNVEMRWVVPSGLGTYPRIYGVIDPGDSIPEIHENNNKGWAILGKESEGDIEPFRTVQKPMSGAWFHCVKTATGLTVDFCLTRPGRIQLSLYDIHGREVKRLVHDRLYARGMHRERFSLHTGNHPASGTLILVARGTNVLHSSKLLLIR